MGKVLQLFKDRREEPRVKTREDLRTHLMHGHQRYTGVKMRLNDLHDEHDALHEMVSNHSHAG